MTDDNTAQSPPPVPSHDGLLDLVVGLAEQGAVTGYGVTLYVQGLLVTGELISREDWIKAWVAAEGAQAGGTTVASLLNKVLADVLAEREETVEAVPFNFIHLQRAQVAHPSGFLPTNQDRPSLWRGRLSQVSAWHVGRLGNGD